MHPAEDTNVSQTPEFEDPVVEADDTIVFEQDIPLSSE